MTTYPSLLRRFYSMFYDGFILLCICILGTVASLFFTRGETISPDNLIYKLYLCSLCFAFITWFWSHGGQTAGMAAWRIRLVTQENQQIGYKQAALRLILAVFFTLLGGIGWLWSLVDRDKQTLYDRLAKTKLVLLKTAKNKN